jgi:2-phosphoglycerate kinase
MTRVILITGAPGSGKTTIAHDLARKLKTFLVVGTDTIREILRSYISKLDNPVLHTSAVLATRYAPKESNKIIWSYENQTSAIKTGIEAVLRRFCREDKDLILEGVHLIPGMIDLTCAGTKGKVKIVQVVLNVTNRKEHIKRLLSQGEIRSACKIAHFNLVRTFQTFLLKKAKENNLLVISNNSIPLTIRKIKKELEKE